MHKKKARRALAARRLCFFSSSADKPPGQGSEEHVVDAHAYLALTATSNWHRVLSSFYPSQAPIPWQSHHMLALQDTPAEHSDGPAMAPEASSEPSEVDVDGGAEAVAVKAKGKRKSSVPVRGGPKRSRGVTRELQEQIREVKEAIPAKAPRPRKPRVAVADLRSQIRVLQAQLDTSKGIRTADTNKIGVTDRMAHEIIGRYRAFVGSACPKIGVPRSFLLIGVEEGTLTSWQQARRIHEEAVHRASQSMVDQSKSIVTRP